MIKVRLTQDNQSMRYRPVKTLEIFMIAENRIHNLATGQAELVCSLPQRI
jgi:hypothetical protein